MTINANPLQCNFVYMTQDSNGYENNSIRFARDIPRQEESSDIQEAGSDSIILSGLTRQQ